MKSIWLRSGKSVRKPLTNEGDPSRYFNSEKDVFFTPGAMWVCTIKANEGDRSN